MYGRVYGMFLSLSVLLMLADYSVHAYSHAKGSLHRVVSRSRDLPVRVADYPHFLRDAIHSSIQWMFEMLPFSSLVDRLVCTM
ncbi:hypothetical protein CPB85DRAFT_1345515 [Mucidula mucida]|nr:hypothetical protein CPB85DRAFT_1345515 [Mucidula mucida]